MLLFSSFAWSNSDLIYGCWIWDQCCYPFLHFSVFLHFRNSIFEQLNYRTFFICLFGVSSSKICCRFLLFSYIWLNISVPFIALISFSGLLHFFPLLFHAFLLCCFWLYSAARLFFIFIFSIDCFIWDKNIHTFLTLPWMCMCVYQSIRFFFRFCSYLISTGCSVFISFWLLASIFLVFYTFPLVISALHSLAFVLISITFFIPFS